MNSSEQKTSTRQGQPLNEDLAPRVALHPFFAGLNRAQLALLTDCAMTTHFQKGQTILREGEFADCFYLIECGKLILESAARFGEPVVIETIGAGSLLGWSWMFPPYAWHFTARALEPTDAIFFHAVKFREQCERDHSLGYAVLKRMSALMIKRLQAARDKMVAVHGGEKLPAVLGQSPFMEQEIDSDESGEEPYES